MTALQDAFRKASISENIKTSAGDDRSFFLKFMAIGTLLAGLVTLAAGVMGFYWGTAVIKPWPPLTWNNCVGGFFMIIFGTMVSILGLNGISQDESSEKAGATIREWAGFLDNFMGRGLFFCYLGLRIMPLGKYYCLMAGLALLFWGFGNIVIHFLWSSDKATAMKQLNYVSVLVGGVVCVAGGMGFYWGTKIIKPWPPLTWNNCVGGLFMFFFGLMICVMVMKGKDPESSWIQKYLLFLDTLIGRGLFFMFVGLRIVPLGQFYCLVAGMVTFGFGVLNLAVHWMYNEKGNPLIISDVAAK